MILKKNNYLKLIHAKMETYISLLRGINVSGKNKIKMGELKALFETMGFLHVQTYLQSGNVLFQSQNESNKTLERMIETKILQNMGLTVAVIIRSKVEIKHTIENNPFLISTPNVAIDKLFVTFLSDEPDEKGLSKLKDIQSGLDTFIHVGKEIYVFCSEGYGRTKLANNFFEAKLKIKATSRNWRTVNELNKMT
jgi:uncharacterized protein (DUF1697 family)